MRTRARPILDLARRGAEARRDLIHELRLLLLAVPHLRDAFDNAELPISFIIAKGSGRLTRRKGAGHQRNRPRAAN
jgi:transcriptional regulator of aromatic amino acid metabolism